MTLRPAPPRLARDKLLELLSDGCYHSAHEISRLPLLDGGKWYIALQELIEFGYAFARRDNSILLRAERATTATPAQDLQALLAGIDATKPDLIGRRDARPAPSQRSSHVVERSLEPRSEAAPPGDQLKLSDDPQTFLPAKMSVTSTRAILARKNSGKTYLAMVIAEEYLRITAETGTPMPFVVIDPTGVWYGLSAKVDGTASPYRVLRLGGKHGDWDVRPSQGEDVAALVVAIWPQPVVVDVSDMLPEEQHQFFGDFGNKLYTINEKPIHIFVDEADEFMPQQVESGNKAQRRALGVGDRMVRRGRVKGIGATLITQRPAVINKNVLSQVDGIFFLSVTAPHDLEAVDSWMKSSVASSDRNLVLEALPSLSRGDAFFVQAHLKAGALMKLQTRAKITFDSSRTPTVDEPEPPVPLLSKVDEVVWRRAGIILGNKIKEPAEEAGVDDSFIPHNFDEPGGDDGEES